MAPQILGEWSEGGEEGECNKKSGREEISYTTIPQKRTEHASAHALANEQVCEVI